MDKKMVCINNYYTIFFKDTKEYNDPTRVINLKDITTIRTTEGY